MAKSRITQKSFLKATQNTGGLITQIAKNLHVDRGQLYKFMKSNKEFCDEILENEREIVTDIAEGQLFKNIIEGQPWSLKFYLATKGKDRGYYEKQVIENRIGLADTEHDIKKIEDHIQTLLIGPSKEKEDIDKDEVDV